MTLFVDGPARAARSGADWEHHRRHRSPQSGPRHRSPQSGPPQDELGALALSSFLLVHTDQVVVAVRSVTAYSDGLHLAVVVLFADEQRGEDLVYAMDDYSRSPGRFRFGCQGSGGRAAMSGTRDAPVIESPDRDGPTLVLLRAASSALTWTGQFWLHPLPPPGPLLLGCRWPDRGIAETLVEINTGPLLEAAATSTTAWGEPTGVLRP